MRLCLPTPYFGGTAALTLSAPLRRVSPSNGPVPAAPGSVRGTALLLTPRDCSRGPACPRESSRHRAAAAFQRFWKITTRVWHRAPPPATLFQHQECGRSPGSAGVFACAGATPPLPGVLPAGEPPLPCGPKPPGLHSAPGESPFPPERRQVWSCGVSASAPPVYRVFREFTASPFSLFSPVPAAVSTFPLTLQLLLGGCFSCISPPPPAPHLHLSPDAKAAPCPPGFSLPQVTSPRRVPAEFGGSSGADCCMNPRNHFLGVQDG